MAITHDKSWDVLADAATERRRTLNVPWPEPKVYSPDCIGCGSKKASKVSVVLCDDCIKQAYSVLETMEK